MVLVIISYLNERNNATYHGFLNLHHDTIITISLSLSSSLSFSTWKKLDNYWTYKFLKEAKNLKLEFSKKRNSDSLEEKVCIFFLFCKKRVTPMTMRPD